VETPGAGSACRRSVATTATRSCAPALPRAKKGPPPSALATVSSTTYCPACAQARAKTPRAARAAQVARQRSAGAGGYGIRTDAAAWRAAASSTSAYPISPAVCRIVLVT
jgi:hypothetical protein